jgi:hypothetical protein
MTYQLNISHKEEKKKENSLLLQAISEKKRELEREQYALVARTMDNITKMEKVLKVKVSITFCLIFGLFDTPFRCTCGIFRMFRSLQHWPKV